MVFDNVMASTDNIHVGTLRDTYVIEQQCGIQEHAKEPLGPNPCERSPSTLKHTI